MLKSTHMELKLIKNPKLNKPTIIEGFPGMGMIGTITTGYIAEKLEMELIGYFSSPHFPPIAAVHNYTPVSPARVYASEKHNLIVLMSEFVIPANVVVPLSEKIIEFANTQKASAIYSLAGIATPEPDEKYYAITSTKKMKEQMEKEKFEVVKEGAAQGVSGVLIAEAAADGTNAANLMIQTNQPMDPENAARLLDKVLPILGIKLDTSELHEEGKKFQNKLQDTMNKLNEMHQNYTQLQEQHGNSMYG